MRTERRAGTGANGFTLIEVLIALVLLGIGFMAVGALGVMAARSVALANRTSEYAVTASHYMEVALEGIRAGTVSCGTTTVDESAPTFVVDRVVSWDADKRTATVEVNAVPRDGVAGQPGTFTAVNSLYIPDEPGNPTPC